MSAFTPGPWRTFLWYGGAFGVTSAPLSEPRGGEITEIVFGPRGGSSEANARLIAAAPELLEACRAAVNLAWEVGCETEDGVHTLLDDSRGDLYRQLSAAIAKATGAA